MFWVLGFGGKWTEIISLTFAFVLMLQAIMDGTEDGCADLKLLTFES